MRYLRAPILEDLRAKTVLLGGPRQVGKTTLALSLLGKDATRTHPAYLNWDDREGRRRILAGELPAKAKLIVLDELHKYPKWRNLLKGFHDTRPDSRSYLVTGSARLNIFRKGGDSLQGRHHYWTLHPFSLGEVGFNQDNLSRLIKFGGFPEPFTGGSERNWRRWRLARREQILRDDVRDLSQIKDLGQMELLVDALPQRVGSPLSIQSLREDLNTAHESIERWIQILESLYFVFRILPYGPPTIRAVKKEKKLYFWDWSEIPSENAISGPRFENLVASHLLKFCDYRQQSEGYLMELRYLRDTDKREIDFVVLQDKKPLFAVESKCGDRAVSPHIRYFKARTGIPKFYQVHLGTKDFEDAETGTRVLPFLKFCKELDLP